MSPDSSSLSPRPLPGAPREYSFPAFERWSLPNGLDVVQAHVPGRPLLMAQLLVRGEAGGGATGERADRAGVTVLTARAMPEGTLQRDAIALVESAERLGADMGTDASWDSLAASVEVPRSRLTPALELLAEMCLQPSFPQREVDRLREERLNDLRQAMADPRRRIERAFPETIYAPDSPFARPLGGAASTVAAIDRDDLVARHEEAMRPSAATLVVVGDLDGVPLHEAVESAFGDWAQGGVALASASVDPARAHPDGPRVVIVDRPGAPQSEVRVGHIGLPRLIPDFHAVSVLNTLLGGLFNSRLNRLLREEKGYTYGAHSGFEMRRAAGPFAVRCAVDTESTIPAVHDILGELRRIRDVLVAPDELDLVRDYLVGVFPLRFESAAQVGAALAGLVLFQLPDDELDRYRPTIAHVDAEQVLAAAQAHIRPDDASVVLVGDASRFSDALGDAGLGPVTVVRDEPVDDD